MFQGGFQKKQASLAKTLLVDFSRFLWFFHYIGGVFESKFPVFDTIRRVCEGVFIYFIRGAWKALYNVGMNSSDVTSRIRPRHLSTEVEHKEFAVI